jgi:hypothetical protein
MAPASDGAGRRGLATIIEDGGSAMGKRLPVCAQPPAYRTPESMPPKSNHSAVAKRPSEKISSEKQATREYQ